MKTCNLAPCCCVPCVTCDSCQVQQNPFVYLTVTQQQPIRFDYKVLQLLQSRCWVNMLTLTLCALRSDRTKSVWMPSDSVKFLIHSIRLLKNKLWHLTGHCHYYLFLYIYIIFFWWAGSCVCLCVHECVCVCWGDCECKGVCVSVCVSFPLLCMTKYE